MVTLKFSTLHLFFFRQNIHCTTLSSSALSTRISFLPVEKNVLKGCQRRTVWNVTTLSPCPIFLDLIFSTEDFRCYKNINAVQHGIKAMSHWCKLYWFNHPAWHTVASASQCIFFLHNYAIFIPEWDFSDMLLLSGTYSSITTRLKTLPCPHSAFRWVLVFFKQCFYKYGIKITIIVVLIMEVS